MMKSFSQVVGSITCPDSEAWNIWPEFWPQTTGPFAKICQKSSFSTCIDIWRQNTRYETTTRARWNKYFRVKNVTEAIKKSKAYLDLWLCNQSTCGGTIVISIRFWRKEKVGSFSVAEWAIWKIAIWLSDDEGLEVLTPRPAAHVKPAHLGADLSQLLTFEVKRALENGLNGGSSSNHKRAVLLDFLSIQHQLWCL